MALYLGNSEKLKITINGRICQLIIPDSVINGMKLKSSDNYILKDSNGIYLIAKGDKKL